MGGREAGAGTRGAPAQPGLGAVPKLRPTLCARSRMRMGSSARPRAERSGAAKQNPVDRARGKLRLEGKKGKAIAMGNPKPFLPGLVMVSEVLAVPGCGDGCCCPLPLLGSVPGSSTFPKGSGEGSAPVPRLR